MAGASFAIVEVKNLEKGYGADRAAVAALRGINVSIAPRELVALRGPSGSGKSTLLNILGCLDRPTRGSYALGGYDVSALDRVQQAWVRLNYLGFIFQSFLLIARSTALENVMLPLQYAGLPREVQKANAQRLLERVGLAERMHHFPVQLSGGERQRVAIARALACKPRVLLADEPTGALDTRSGEEIMQLIGDVQRDAGLTVIMVTHDPRIAARADRQIYLLDGRIVDHGVGGDVSSQ
jgi:putative ABC transport system ATP-binding protein